jgi:CheY-like chemotaxis protein
VWASSEGRRLKRGTPVVAILDRDPVSCSALLRELAALGRDAVVVDTPAELVQRLRADVQCEVVLIELEIDPEDGFLDGVDLVVQIARDHPAIRRVLMSSHPDARRHETAGDPRGVHAVLAKPFTRASLVRALGTRE